MELAQHYTEVEWNGNSIQLPINHAIERYDVVSRFDSTPAMSRLIGSKWSGGAPEFDDEVNLAFDVTMALPINSSGELYYEYFGRPSDFKIEGVEGGAIKLGFRADAICNVADTENWTANTVGCGLVARELALNPSADKDELEDTYDSSHICVGAIEDAVWIVHEVGHEIDLGSASWLLDEIEGGDGDIWSLSIEQAREAFGYTGEDFFVGDTEVGGKTYRTIVITHQD